MKKKDTYFTVIVEGTYGCKVIDFNRKCNKVKNLFEDFIGFFNSNDDNEELLLRIIPKNKIIEIRNIGTEDD